MLSVLPLAIAVGILQNVAVQPVPRNEDWWTARHAEKVAVTQAGGYDVAFLGDSITQSWEGPGRPVWDREFAPMRAANFGFSGDRTEHVLWRLQNGELVGGKPKAVVIMIGTNNLGHGSSNPSQTAEGIRAIVGLLRRELPQAKILLLAVFPRDAEPNGKFRLLVEDLNRQIRNLNDGRHVFFLDIGGNFLQADGRLRPGRMPDQLHLDPIGYDLWARAIREPLQEMLGTAEQPPRAGRWRSLFDGKTLKGWTQKNGTAKYEVVDGAIVGSTAQLSPNSFLCSDETFGDFELEFETNVDTGLNSGVQIRSRQQENGRVWGPQVEIEASDGEAGSVWGESTSFGWLNPNPPATAVYRNGEWNRYRVIAQGPRIRTWINGLPVADLRHDGIYASHPNGFIGLQVHSIGPTEGPWQVRWRNIRIRELR